jgi:hypothetical protein
LQHVGKPLLSWSRLLGKGGDIMRIGRTFLIGFDDDVYVPSLTQRDFEVHPKNPVSS